MTKPENKWYKPEGQAGDNDVTPAMIEAGARVLTSFTSDIGPYSARHLANEIFEAMLAAGQKMRPFEHNKSSA